MRYSKIDMTMNVYTDPMLLMFMVPWTSCRRWISMQIPRPKFRPCDRLEQMVEILEWLPITQSFVGPDVAPTSGKPGLFESSPVTLGSLYDGQIKGLKQPKRGQE